MADDGAFCSRASRLHCLEPIHLCEKHDTKDEREGSTGANLDHAVVKQRVELTTRYLDLPSWPMDYLPLLVFFDGRLCLRNYTFQGT